ncbi:hypothetical protein [Isoptericola sp. BMS4]|uniref:hypothetical protein n=1 Tax=Isoptericola sp. BMS4 TaxID=2527875 RepID=UPI00141F3091|nr:hypothetical protein [Isoptericola sp. BMS4]
MSRSARPARTAVVATGAVAAAALLAACSPTTTVLPYAPSDGARVNLTDSVRGINLMVVSEGDGAPGALLGALANDSGEDVSFELATAGNDTVSLVVPAGETVYLSAPDQPEQSVDARLGAIDTYPGGELDATLSGAGVDEEFGLPVFDGTLPEYAPYVPDALVS